MIGVGTMNSKLKLQSIDLLQAVADMTSDEKFCFFQIKDKIKFDPYTNDYIYQIRIYSKDYTPSQKVMFSRGFKLLEAKNIVKRIKRGTYQISPLALIPKDFDKEYLIWKSE